MNVLSHWLLTVLLLIPLLGAGAVALGRKRRDILWVATATTSVSLILSLLILLPFHWNDGSVYEYAPAGTVQLHAGYPFIAAAAFNYSVAIDGLSFPLVVFTTLMFVAGCVASRDVSVHQSRYFSLLLLLEFAVLGTLVSFDLLLFWFFSALMLAAAAALLVGWGGSGSRRAAMRMLIVLGLGLVLLAVVIVGEFLAARRALGSGSFDLVRLAGPQMRRLFMMASWSPAGRAFFVCAVIAFAMRLPVLPFQGWFSGMLAQAHTPVAMVLAGVIPITGGYGLLRIAGPLFPAAATSLWSVCAILSLVSIVYCALCAAAPTEISRSIGCAISSFSSFALLGVASRSSTGTEGTVLIMLSTGLIAALLIRDGRYAHQKSSLISFAVILVLVVPGLLSQMMVLMGVFLAIRSDSLLRLAGAASPAALYVTAAATCLGILLTGVWAARLLNAFFASPDLTAPSSTEPDGGRAGTAVVLAVLAILLGILPTPLCLIFSHSAIRVLLHG